MSSTKIKFITIHLAAKLSFTGELPDIG